MYKQVVNSGGPLKACLVFCMHFVSYNSPRLKSALTMKVLPLKNSMKYGFSSITSRSHCLHSICRMARYPCHLKGTSRQTTRAEAALGSEYCVE
jgi:hypothetical protein